MIKRLYLISFFALLLQMATAQSISDTAASKTNAHGDSTQHLIELNFIGGDYTLMEVDALDNIYLLTKDNQLWKLNSSGDSVSVYNDVKNHGKAGSISVANPMQLLVYYPAFKSIVVLDRLLAEKGKLNFREQNIFALSAIASSYDNHIWLFDSQNMQLKKMNINGEVLMSSTDFRTFLNQLPEPENIIDADNAVYLYDSTLGFFIFDRYGSYARQIPLPGLQHTGVSGNFLYGINELGLTTFNLLNNTSRMHSLVQKGIRSVSIMNGKLYLLQGDGVHVYRLK